MQALDLAKVEKGEGIPDNTALKNYFLFLLRTTVETLSNNSGTKLKAWKLKPAERFRHLLLE